MCAISGSFQVYKLEQLYKLNAYRGELSYSFNAFKVNNNRVELAVAYSDDGPLPGENDDHCFPSAPTSRLGRNLQNACRGSRSV